MLKRIALVAGIAVPASLAAQQATAHDPHSTIRQLTERIADEMQRVDGLLVETGRPDAEDGTGPARSVQQAGARLDETSTTQARVVRGLDALIEELLAHARSGCGGGA